MTNLLQIGAKVLGVGISYFTSIYFMSSLHSSVNAVHQVQPMRFPTRLTHLAQFILEYTKLIASSSRRDPLEISASTGHHGVLTVKALSVAHYSNIHAIILLLR